MVMNACDSLNRFEPSAPTDSPLSSTDSAAVGTTNGLAGPSFYTGATAPGIPFGAFNLPNSYLNSVYSGSVRALGPSDILSTLAAARRVGARVILRMAGGDSYYQNSDGSFNLTKWKARVARFTTVNIAPYISDGTFLGHFLVDEPFDPSNWGGKPIPFATLEAMAKYSKQLWPGLTTVVRATPRWLAGASFRYGYLDAAWAQYSARFGDVTTWIRSQAGIAKNEGLGLVVGLNWLSGGRTSGQYPMSASQVKSYGTVLATTSYACAFYGWQYSSSYFGRSDIKSALSAVSSKSKYRARQTCKP
jgi:hypothetical protein